MAKQGTFQVNTQHIDNLTRQIESVTDCSALIQIFEQHLDSVSDLVESKIETQVEILKSYLPLLKLPGINPAAIVKWLKKLVTGTIMPQLRAYINLAIQIVRLTTALSRLVSAIESADDKLKKCLNETLIDTVKFKLQTQISSLKKPLDDALAQIDSIQTQIETLIENPLNERIVTDTLEGFLDSAERAFPGIEAQVIAFGEEEDDSPEPLTANVSIEGAVLQIENGVIISVANTA